MSMSPLDMWCPNCGIHNVYLYHNRDYPNCSGQLCHRCGWHGEKGALREEPTQEWRYYYATRNDPQWGPLKTWVHVHGPYLQWPEDAGRDSRMVGVYRGGKNYREVGGFQPWETWTAKVQRGLVVVVERHDTERPKEESRQASQVDGTSLESTCSTSTGLSSTPDTTRDGQAISPDESSSTSRGEQAHWCAPRSKRASRSQSLASTKGRAKKAKGA